MTARRKSNDAAAIRQRIEADDPHPFGDFRDQLVGARGKSGTNGPRGHAGSAGPQGDVGPAGVAGPAGPAGAVGPAGVTGEQGPAGGRGRAGDLGAPGEPGAPGPDGPRGRSGPAGITGANGLDAPTQKRFSTHGWESIGTAVAAVGAAIPASQTWPLSNMVELIPFRLADTVTPNLITWLNGASVAGNIHVGIYAAQSLALIATTGAIAQAGVAAYQSAAIVCPAIGPGRFYLAIGCTSNGALVQSKLGSGFTWGVCGCGEATAALPLPNPITFTLITRTDVPIVLVTIAE